MNKRRKLVIALGAGAVTAPFSSFAQQQGKVWRIGYLLSQTLDAYFDMFQQHMRELGYIEGKNILFERRNAEGLLDRTPALIRELVEQKVSILVVNNNVAIDAARKATTTIPIVMVTSIDPVTAGYVASLAHPGGNITGVASLNRELSAKRIELLREIFPKLSRMAILWDEAGPGPKTAFKNYEAAAKAMKVRVQSLAIQGSRPDIEGAFRAAKTGGAEVIVIVANPTINANRMTVMELALKYRLPSMVENDTYIDGGGLMSYGTSRSEITQRMAVYVDKILKGAKPSNLPIEQPTKFELVINMKTAKALGIKIPNSILVQAIKVIE
jgi:putative ABC transport system substrate-binding protein